MRVLTSVTLAALVTLAACQASGGSGGQGPTVLGQPDSPLHPTISGWPHVGCSPTLAWQPFPLDQDRFVLGQGRIDSIEDLTYDLVVISVDSLKKVYEVTALPEAEHRIEVELEPHRQFFWSIRARFVLDGETRVTRWRSAANKGGKRESVLPFWWFYHFRTTDVLPPPRTAASGVEADRQGADSFPKSGPAGAGPPGDCARRPAFSPHHDLALHQLECFARDRPGERRGGSVHPVQRRGAEENISG